jgi:surfeit locus 1 family protein
VSLLLADSPASAGDGLQRDWPAPSSGMAKNQGYAAQWFALSALILGLYVWFQLIQPFRRRARG